MPRSPFAGSGSSTRGERGEREGEGEPERGLVQRVSRRKSHGRACVEAALSRNLLPSHPAVHSLRKYSSQVGHPTRGFFAEHSSGYRWLDGEERRVPWSGCWPPHLWWRRDHQHRCQDGLGIHRYGEIHTLPHSFSNANSNPHARAPLVALHLGHARGKTLPPQHATRGGIVAYSPATTATNRSFSVCDP